MKYEYTVTRNTIKPGIWFVVESAIDADGALFTRSVIDKTTSEVAAKDMAAVLQRWTPSNLSALPIRK
tara:strand:- start:171 stop:374 length:204 start_codon:yes stop_codon:yes gene_type:complete